MIKIVHTTIIHSIVKLHVHLVHYNSDDQLAF
jgi:hypothetical protein